MLAAAQSFRVDCYVVDVLMRDLVGHDHSPAAFLVFMLIWRHTRGTNGRGTGTRLSHRQIALEIGLSKSAVQQALRTLHRRGLVISTQRHRTDVPEHRVVRLWAHRATPAAH
jgi:DNA-binding MarR family transcriptional regulator